MNKKRNVYAFVITVSILLTVSIFAVAVLGLRNPSESSIRSSAALTITANMDLKNYTERQKAIVSGNVSLGGLPANNFLVAVEVSKPTLYGPYSFQTLEVGNPTGLTLVNITNISIKDASNNPIDTIKAGSQMYVSMNVYNVQSTSITIFATTTVYDENMVALNTNSWTSSLDPLQTAGQTYPLMQVPSWAASGRSVIIGCVYSNEPASGGLAYCPQSAFYYDISRTQTGLLGITQPPQPAPQNTPGSYVDPISLPTAPRLGKYSVFVMGQVSPATTSSATTSFNVQSVNGIPPQASFAYYPPNPSINIDVSFDGSSSTPEGYNDIITKYDWNFGDGTAHYVSTGNPANPMANHVYTLATQYIVTLNVTNNEGLWCTTSKPITISLGYGPTANFTWAPQNAVINETLTFDASNSTPGSFSTLVNYTWNFSDGTGNFTVTTNQTPHVFTQPGNYSVMLTVLDSLSRTASTSATVQVQNATIKIYDITGDGKIDGRDIAIVARSFGSYPGCLPPLLWNPIADINGDGKCDGKDIAPVARNFGQDP
ncbi:MAG: PKD domain-containing protein [Candidatus Bathyarchaeia archaeon]